MRSRQNSYGGAVCPILTPSTIQITGAVKALSDAMSPANSYFCAGVSSPDMLLISLYRKQSVV
jgi:hypothetical protein